MKSSWDEPAYSKRKEWPEIVLSTFLTIGMAVFVFGIIILFLFQMKNSSGKYTDSLFGFWGSVAGAMIDGLVTINGIVVGKKKYLIVYSREYINCKLRYYDIYGNYYYQQFKSEYSSDNNLHMDLNGNPPELILRTDRIRYKQ